MKKPIIGLTSTRFLVEGDSLTGMPKTVLNEDYTKAIEVSGGIPIIIPSTLSVDLLSQYIDMCDGIVVTGGKDVHPLLYDTQPIESCGKFDKYVDESHIKLIELALDADKPILGICRGAQLINVTCGGTLYQDLKSEIPYDIQGHNFRHIRSDEVHHIGIENNTRLYKLFGERVGVNSIHHQSIKTLGEGLYVSAKSYDGVIEGVEMPDKKYVLGVQWHPEMMLTGCDKMMCVFEDFIGNCK